MPDDASDAEVSTLHNMEEIYAARYAAMKGPSVTHHLVVVEGRRIPGLTMRERGDGEQCSLILDDRFVIDVPHSLAPQVAWLVANALAIGQGYPSLNAETKDHPFAPQIHVLSAVEANAEDASVLPFTRRDGGPSNG